MDKTDDSAFHIEQEHLAPEYKYIQRMDGKDAVTLYDISGDHSLVGVTLKVRPDYFPKREVYDGTAPNTKKYLAHKFKHEPRKIRGYHLSVTHVVHSSPDMAEGEYFGRAGDVNLFRKKLPEEMALASFVAAHENELPRPMSELLKKLYITPNLLLETSKSKCMKQGETVPKETGEDFYVESGVDRAVDETSKMLPKQLGDMLGDDWAQYRQAVKEGNRGR